MCCISSRACWIRLIADIARREKIDKGQLVIHADNGSLMRGATLRAKLEELGIYDNTMIMYFPENGETHHGVGTEAPFLILSGNNCNLDIAGRYIRLPYLGNPGHKTLGNWYTTLLNAHGNPIGHYGDLDLEMARKKLPQTGAIQQFMG